MPGVNVIGGRPVPQPQRSARRVPAGRMRDYGPLGAGIVGGSTAIADAMKELSRQRMSREAMREKYGYEKELANIRESGAESRANIAARSNEAVQDSRSEATGYTADIGLEATEATVEGNITVAGITAKAGVTQSALLYAGSVLKTQVEGLIAEMQTKRSFRTQDAIELSRLMVSSEQLAERLHDREYNSPSATMAREIRGTMVTANHEALKAVMKSQLDSREAPIRVKAEKWLEQVTSAERLNNEFKGKWSNIETFRSLLKSESSMFKSVGTDVKNAATRMRGEFEKHMIRMAATGAPQDVLNSLMNESFNASEDMLSTAGIVSGGFDSQVNADRFRDHLSRSKNLMLPHGDIVGYNLHLLTLENAEKMNVDLRGVKHSTPEQMQEIQKIVEEFSTVMRNNPELKLLNAAADEEGSATEGERLLQDQLKAQIEPLKERLIQQTEGSPKELADFKMNLFNLRQMQGASLGKLMGQTAESDAAASTRAVMKSLAEIVNPPKKVISATQPAAGAEPSQVPTSQPVPQIPQDPEVTDPAEGPDPNAQSAIPGLSEDSYLQMQDAFNSGFPARPFQEDEVIYA